jgi:ribosomal protein L23
MYSTAHIIRKVVTEKATSQERNQVYVFEVNPNSTKTQIAEAIRILYGEKPLAVRVVTRAPQTKKVGKLRREVQTAVRKLAYIQTKNPINNLSKA